MSDILSISEEKNPLVLPDGTKIYTLMDLYIWLMNADEDRVKILLNNKENKLAKWVKKYFNNISLYEDLLHAKTKEDAFNILHKHIFREMNKLKSKPKISKAEVIYLLSELK